MLSYICAKLFFGKVVVKNQNKIPSSGPLIFVANHRNMILDAGMIRYSCKRNLYYLAKHTIFENKILGWIFKNANAIPVYRHQDNPNLVSKNIESFNAAYNIFKSGGLISQANQAKEQFPSIEEIFNENMEVGEPMNTGCWINETVTLNKR